jgi:hypothetical protein
MSLIHNGTGTDSFVKSPEELYTNRLLAKIAELEKDCADLQECFDTCYDELGATRDAHDVLEGEAVIAMKQHHDLCWKIEEIEESVRVDHAIASDYAMALFNRYYKDIADSIPLALCSTSGGVVTQIDNMVAGVMLDMAEEITALEKRLSNAETMGDKAQSIRDLEQQAKGVKSFANSCLGDDILNHKNLALKYASLIHAQAQALKETK